MVTMSDGESSDGEVDFKPAVDVEALPKVVQNRIKALKNVQLDVIKAERDYYKEIHQLDIKYQSLFDDLNKKRTTIVEGAYEPSGKEIEWTVAAKDDEEEELANGVEKIKIEGMTEDTKGIPHFWMYVLKNANESVLMGTIEPHDEPVLEFLTDITVELSKPSNTGFTLRFHFADNPFFTNSVLTKEYTLREDPDQEDPLQYDGPEIVGAKGCSIDWKAGKDVTKTKIPIKKLRKKGPKATGDKTTVTKEVKADSFFNFFSPPEIKEGDKPDEESAGILALDFDIGFSIKEKIIPRAVLYFTGEAYEDDDEYDDLDSDEEEDDTEEED